MSNPPLSDDAASAAGVSDSHAHTRPAAYDDAAALQIEAGQVPQEPQPQRQSQTQAQPQPQEHQPPHTPEPIKYTRGPTLQRPSGPSLLTQALATARGIPRDKQISAFSSSQPTSQDKDNEGRHESSTPRSSPRKTTMHGRLDLGEVNSRLLNGEHCDRERDGRPPQPARPLPEKVWSIGAGDAGIGEDGKVEKSISEVLAGVEPNNRSRKASHSLRFFKEGLPDEQRPKKKEHKSEKLQEIQERSVDEKLKSGGDNGTGSHIRSQAAFPSSSEKGIGRDIPPEDQAVKKPEGDNVVSVVGSPPSSPGAGDSEEGQESGEEQISSAVFVPHKDPEEQPEDHAATPRPTPSRRHSRHDDYHPWLVKADEPEPDEEELEEERGEDEHEPAQEHKDKDKDKHKHKQRRIKSDAADGCPTVAPEVALRQVDQPTPTPTPAPHDDDDDDDHDDVDDESERSARAQSSSSSAPYHEEAAYDHYYNAPRQPLEAIELIPYKHQVGGHTTLWRFSKRAVCKQLNNRENEFYEKIEKYHRDLLRFLPRYIGVLNVTFQKQPRRKSTKREDAGEPQAESQAGAAETSQDGQPRMVSQSMQSTAGQIPTVTFVDNRHILPRNLLQPSLPPLAGRFRSASESVRGATSGNDSSQGSAAAIQNESSRTGQQERPNSWGATTVNKKLRNEVFNDAFLKQPIAIHRHRKGHHRPFPRPRPVVGSEGAGTPASAANGIDVPLPKSAIDLAHADRYAADDELGPRDITGTSAPEPEILGDTSPAQRKKKRRYSGSGLRRKPKDVQDGRGDLEYFEEADDVDYKSARGDVPSREELKTALSQRTSTVASTVSSTAIPTASTSPAPLSTTASADGTVGNAVVPNGNGQHLAPVPYKIPRPLNPKEAQTQRNTRVEYFLLLEDLTAGMKRPCIMDLKMGTRQYGVDATPKKQKSQQGKCAKTTSRELGVRVCGLQVWDVKTQSYVFKDKYYGRELKKGAEFQAALTRFLYDGVDKASILRHVPTVLRKLDELEVIIERLRGYRFYAASLLMFYDGDQSSGVANGEDETTDFTTDAEEVHQQPQHGNGAAAQQPRRTRKSRREIDFKMADFANCVTAGDGIKDRPCPPRHPGEPDRGFLRGLRSLRKYFLKIQRDTRVELGLAAPFRNGNGEKDEWTWEDSEEEGSVSE